MDRGDPTLWKPTRISTDEHPAYQRRDAGGPRYGALSSVLSGHWFRRIIRRRAGHIYELPSGRQLLNLILTPAYTGLWWGRLIFRVDKVDDLHASFMAKGMQAEPPRDGSWGERYFHIKDPDGHELSFAQLLR